MSFGAMVNFILVPVNIFLAICLDNPSSYVAAGACFLLGCVCYINGF